jgi:hypothetical protein
MDTDAPEEEWVTLAEAAGQLGVSVVTLRRRLREGRFEAKQIPTRYGAAWIVKIGDLTGTSNGRARGATADALPSQAETREPGSDPRMEAGYHAEHSDPSNQGEQADSGREQAETSDPGQPSLSMVEALGLISKLQEENKSLVEGMLQRTEAAAIWQGRAEVLQFQLHQVQERLLALEAPKPAVGSIDASETATRQADAAISHPRPWWQLIWLRLVGNASSHKS